MAALDIRIRLEGRIGSPLSDDAWARLVDDGYVVEALDLSLIHI